MYVEETLHKIDGEQRQYEEPDGEYIDLIESGNNTITVLTKVQSEKGGEVELDPSDLTVSELTDFVNNSGLASSQISTLLELEQDGKNRKSAKEFLKNEL